MGLIDRRPAKKAAETAGPSPYEDPGVALWLGSFEGIPEPAGPARVQPAAGQAGLPGWRAYLNGRLELIGQLMPGLGLAVGLAYLSYLLAGVLGERIISDPTGRSPISPILVAIVLGLVLRNLIGLPAGYDRGLHLCLKKILRIGVALLGIRLSLFAAGATSLRALPIVLGCILTALVLVTWIGKRMGLPRRLGFLIAVGTSICGVSAIVATAPVIDAEKDETSYAVSCVAVFGMIALFSYPFLAHWMYADNPDAAGFFLGTAIHDTSQVAGAGLMYQQQFDSPQVLNVAVLTKLVRNLCMVWLIPLIAIVYHKREAGSDAARLPWYRFIPVFVIGFIAMTALRTVGDLGEQTRLFGFLAPDTWKAAVGQTTWLAKACLTVAMVAVGLGTSLSTLRRLGLRPFAIGLLAAVLVGGASILLITLTVGS
jgi:uncharacterized integral membrane protein (TIGR00698 family)